MPRIVLSGAGGFVGGRVVEAARGPEVHALWRGRPPPPGAIGHQVDLDDRDRVAAIVEAICPDVVLHTAYDMSAGPEPNLRWSRNLFAATKVVGARIVLVSTDLVFDGRRGWYSEEDTPQPVIPYGAWKLELEQEVLAAGGVVARTALVWGVNPLPDSTDQLVLAPLRRGEPPRLFEDEWRTPTEVHDLAEALLQACDVAGPRVLHLAGPERLSRLELGRLLAGYFGFDGSRIPPSRRDQVAPERPRDTSLAVSSTREVISVRFRGPSEILAVSRANEIRSS